MACKYMHIVNSITADTTAGSLTLGFVNTASAVNEQRFCFKIPCGVSIPSGSDAYAVLLTINGSPVTLWDKYGNPATGSDLVKGRVIKGYFGNTSSDHVIATNVPVTYNCGCNNVL